uniref:Uncharacterized protein n=1 Tax=Macrostomum lignano TaxID=282301 RepID=A0A1I8FBW5_9PLAT
MLSAVLPHLDTGVPH